MPRQPSRFAPSRATSAARNCPTGVAVCSQPVKRTRTCSGTDSCSSGVPAAHSPPTPNPAMNRKTAKLTTPTDNPQSAVKMEYTTMVQHMTRTRPNRSAAQPHTMEQAQPSMKMENSSPP